MKTYIEAIEDITGKPYDYRADFIKEEIINTEKKAKDKCRLKEKSGKTYKYRKHICNHKEGQPCTVEEIQ